MPETIIHILDIFDNGEFDRSLPFRTLEGAERAACQGLAAALADGDQFAESAGVEDIDEFNELRGNMLELFENEAYFPMLEIFDEWVTAFDFEGPSPWNYNITERVLE